MDAPFGDSAGKRVVRTLWNTPILQYLHETYKMRFRYMGLPGEDCLDVVLWRDMIDEVIAFELEGTPDAEYPDGRRAIATLAANLERMGIPNRVYVGAMEEVVLLRTDLDDEPFDQAGLITLYNLDFCGEIQSRVKAKRERHLVTRYSAIKRILTDQRSYYDQTGGRCLFAFLITVSNKIEAKVLADLLSGELSAETSAYLESCGGVENLPDDGKLVGTHTWGLKAFLFNTLKYYFAHPSISAVFFPVVKYTGKTDQSPMFHFMLLCGFSKPQHNLPPSYPAAYLSSATSVRAKDDALAWDSEPGESAPPPGAPSPVDLYRSIEADFLAAIV